MAAPTDYLAHYKLLDDANDETGNHNGVSTGVVFDGEGASFDGTGDTKIEIPISLSEALSGSTGATISAVINEVNEVGDNYAVSIANNKMMIGLNFEGDDFSTVFNVDSNIKNIYLDASDIGTIDGVHVLAVMDITNEITTLYINGEEVDSRTFASGTVWENRSDISLIGIYDPTDPTYMAYDGKLSNLRLYDRVLSESEISAVFMEDTGSGGDDIIFDDFIIVSSNTVIDTTDLDLISSNNIPVFVDFEVTSENKPPDFIDFEISSIAHRGVVIDFDIISTSTKDPEFINLNIISENIPSDTESPNHYSAQLIRRVL